MPIDQRLRELRKALDHEDKDCEVTFYTSVAEECVDKGWLIPTNGSYRLTPLGREVLEASEGY